MIWFTSDTHFNHANIDKLSNRNFGSLEAMEAAIITNWNNVVSSGDTVYHLGDFALSSGKKDADLIDSILAKLKGNKWLISGNHDRDEVKKNTRWVKVVDYHELKIDTGGETKQKIVLFHYAMRVWNQMHRGAWMLHGHSHGNLIDVGGKILDVGTDVHKYCPISVETVKNYMETREIVFCDHHKNE